MRRHWIVPDHRWITDTAWYGVAVFTILAGTFNVVLVVAVVSGPTPRLLLGWWVSAVAHATILAFYIKGCEWLRKLEGRELVWPWERP